MNKKTPATLPNPQAGLPHQVVVADEAALPDAIRQAVITSLQQLQPGSGATPLRITQEAGYRDHSLYRLALADGTEVPLCVIGPLVQPARTGSKQDKPDTIDVRFGDYAEEFFAHFFQKSAAYRRCTVYQELLGPEEGAVDCSRK